MDTPHQETSPTKSSAPSASHQRPGENLVRCLDALDQKGEAGLQAELDRLYPPAPAEDDGRPIGTWDPLDESEANGLKTVNWADLRPQQQQALMNGDSSTLEPSASPK